jgi:FtsP/CotA-like multicopper oxidase with cupredoxin domain
MLRRDFLKLSATGALMTTAPSLLASPANAQSSAAKVITAGKRAIEVTGKAVNVLGLTQPGGSHGLVMNAGENFRVLLENRISEPTAIHWLGSPRPGSRTVSPASHRSRSRTAGVTTTTSRSHVPAHSGCTRTWDCRSSVCLPRL